MHNRYLKIDPWKIIENQWNPDYHEQSESIFSIGNGKMGQRAMFEESYSGKTLQGSYVAGVYYPDTTRVGWWKNGYPENFAKVLNSPNWIGIDVTINDESLDFATVTVDNFERVLDMKEGLLLRSATLTMKNGAKIKLLSKRFVSMAEDEVGAIEYSIEAVNQDISVRFFPYLNSDVYNEDANYDEKFWVPINQDANEQIASLSSKTKKTDFHVGFAFTSTISGGNIIESFSSKENETIGRVYVISLAKGEKTTINKYVGIASSLYYTKDQVQKEAERIAKDAQETTFNRLLDAHKAVWQSIWNSSDIQIEGDPASQQGIRFNIFHMNQTYTGKDKRLNIGPKGFTGEKYGGSTYWDTEAYCLPFYLNTADYKVAKQLLMYRHNHLPKAIKNAEKLGFRDGAALYPMVTMDGTESHNEWEITFEEIHRNGAIAFAIFNYIRHSEDKDYLHQYGLDVLIAISKFWAQRVNYSEAKKAWVMLGVTGPNEYENNVNNNWYTNYVAQWTLQYTMESIDYVSENNPKRWEEIKQNTQLTSDELVLWKDITSNMYFPYDETLNIYLQQDNFLDKDILPADTLPSSIRPINQFWSWDRILRSCYIKQADTLQGFYFFEDNFSTEELERHFDFYEPITVHESSLSPCVHVVLAAKLNRIDKAYEMYLRTSRLDLDDYNREVHEGLHITSMAGTWMSVVEGFGGLRIKNNQLYLEPRIPEQWTSYQFRISFRGRELNIYVSKEGTKIDLIKGDSMTITINGEQKTI